MLNVSTTSVADKSLRKHFWSKLCYSSLFHSNCSSISVNGAHTLYPSSIYKLNILSIWKELVNLNKKIVPPLLFLLSDLISLFHPQMDYCSLAACFEAGNSLMYIIAFLVSNLLHLFSWYFMWNNNTVPLSSKATIATGEMLEFSSS